MVRSHDLTVQLPSSLYFNRKLLKKTNEQKTASEGNLITTSNVEQLNLGNNFYFLGILFIWTQTIFYT